MLKVCFVTVAVVLAFVPGNTGAEDEGDWWKTAAFYQIYPRSFQDSDGDGTGDLKGITSRLDHVVNMGYGAVWLSPIFESPMADFGYDISDFGAIDKTFGTMDDFKALIARANELGIKVILDFVPNHSSDECEWFVKSKAKDPNFDNYYIWMDPLGFDNSTGIEVPIPPNQWIGAFSESVWEYVEERNQFYYHRYNVKQPDLNYRSATLRHEMEDVLTFWLDNGAHGFRVDSIHTLVESGFPDVPNSESDKYSICQPETYETVAQWRKLLDEYSTKDNVTRIMMTEAFGTTEQVMAFYGNETVPLAHFTFNFKLHNDLNRTSTAQEFVDMIDYWMDNMPEGGTANWVIGNHDQHRVGSRYGNELAAGLAMMSFLLPGVVVSYNGEEIGMVDNLQITYNETLDPAGVNAGPDEYLVKSRDFERTPFQWDATTNAGFSTAEKTWLPIHANYKYLNLAQERSEENSYYKIYKRLMAARSTDTIRNGDLTTVAVSNNVFVVARAWDLDNYIVVINLGDDRERVDLREAMPSLQYDLMYPFTSSPSLNLNPGNPISTKDVVLHPKTSVVLSNNYYNAVGGSNVFTISTQLLLFIPIWFLISYRALL